MQSKQSNILFYNTLYTSLKEHRGAIIEVARRTGFSRETVRHTLKGIYKNEQVILEAAFLLKELRKERSKTIRTVKNAIAS